MRVSLRRGGSSITPSREGSTPRLIAGGPSMMMLIHRIWIAVNGVGQPSRLAPSTVWIAPILVDNWKRTNLTMLS